jgi:hypothetical protein
MGGSSQAMGDDASKASAATLVQVCFCTRQASGTVQRCTLTVVAVTLQACWRGHRTRARVVQCVRAEFAARVEALDGDAGDARVSWRRPRTLCAPDVQAPAANTSTLAVENDDAAGAADGGTTQQVEARRTQLHAELAWAEAALASRRAQLRGAREARQ